jgi:hypothetical protein
VCPHPQEQAVVATQGVQLPSALDTEQSLRVSGHTLEATKKMNDSWNYTAAQRYHKEQRDGRLGITAFLSTLGWG